PGRLIDLGCGTGRALLPLAQRGFRVLGVDLSEEMLRIVGEKAEAAGLQVLRIKANLVQLDSVADSSFNYALCLFSTLGMIVGTEHRRQVIQHAARLLRPGGVFILHVHNYWFNAWDRGGRRWLLTDLVRWVIGHPESGDRAMPSLAGGPTLSLHHF